MMYQEIDRSVLAVEQQHKKPVKLESFHDGYIFRVDYDPNTARAVLENDIDTYIAEYRLGIQKSEYKLQYSRGTEGKLALRSSDNDESMLAIGRRGIKQREVDGKSTRKETADLLGMYRLEDFMAQSQHGDTMLWVSPPDDEVGYEYGFFYVGKVEEKAQGEKTLNMNAIRLDNKPSFQQCNDALSLLTQQQTDHSTANEFVSNPYHVRREISDQELQFVLKGVFAFEHDEKQETRKKRVLTLLTPYKETFFSAVRNGSSKEEKQKLLFSIENLALELHKKLEAEETNEQTVFLDYSSLAPIDKDALIDAYGFKPPRVAGTCDDMEQQGGSPNIFGYDSVFARGTPGGAPEFGTSYDKYGKMSFNCPKCNYENKRPFEKLIKYCQNTLCMADVSC